MKLIKKPQTRQETIKSPKINFGKVTTITPSYNRYDSLLTTIRSIKEQTHNNIEMIVINDGSDDPRYDTLPELGVKHIKIEHTGLHMIAMNYGIKESTGDYIALIDDDDPSMPSRIESQLNAMFQSGCGMSSSNAYTGPDFFDYNKQNSKELYFKEQLPKIFNKELLQKCNYCMNSSVIFAKNLLYKTGLFNEHELFRHCADWDLWKRMVSYTNCFYIDEPLIYYRDNRTPSSMRQGWGGKSCQNINDEIQKLIIETGLPFPECVGSIPPKLS
jgi:glycosyltransferase involved in cell wall biosynthesis